MSLVVLFVVGVGWCVLVPDIFVGVCCLIYSSLPGSFRMPSVRTERSFRMGICASLVFFCLCFPCWFS